MHKKIKKLKNVQTCEQYQLKNFTRAKKIKHFIWIFFVFQNWNWRGSYALLTRISLFCCWPVYFIWLNGKKGFKMRILFKLRNFYEKTLFVCKDVLGNLWSMESSKNKKLMEILTAKYEIQKIQISAYHFQANGIVEKKHRPIVDVLAKMEERILKNK